MICYGCRENDHKACPGGTWCDCQHRPYDGAPEEKTSGAA